MNKVDLVILLIILAFMLLGYYKGLVKSVLSVVQYFLVIILSISLAPTVSKILIENFHLDLLIIDWITNNENFFADKINIISEEILQNFVGRIINVIAIILLFVILKIIFAFVIMILNKIANLPILSLVNRLGGLALGAINGVLVVYLVILLINWLPLEAIKPFKEEVDSSFLGFTINTFVPEVTADVISRVKISV